MSASLVVFVLLQLAVYTFLAYAAGRWYAAMWTLKSFDNLFVTASLIACGLTAISAVAMLIGLILMLAGKGAGRGMGLAALFINTLGGIFLCGVVVFNAITTNTAMISLLNQYFMPTALVLVNAIAGTFYLLSSEGLKEHLAYRRMPKHEPPRPRLPERPAGDAASEAETEPSGDSMAGQTSDESACAKYADTQND